MKFNQFLLLALTVGILFGQKGTWKVEAIGAPRPADPPLKPVTCTASDSGYGHVHFGERTKLTPEEIGMYVVGATENGSVITLYPEDKHGWFVSTVCPEH
jgi:hypothetical protein